MLILEFYIQILEALHRLGVKRLVLGDFPRYGEVLPLPDFVIQDLHQLLKIFLALFSVH